MIGPLALLVGGAVAMYAGIGGLVEWLARRAGGDMAPVEPSPDHFRTVRPCRACGAVYEARTEGPAGAPLPERCLSCRTGEGAA